MSRQSRNTASPAVASPATRMNEYFVPRDGIDREVISADICRYLGNDALVRPGHYENPATGQNVQGYYITAYRNLTTAMIEDLKADSARWDNERRTQSARNTNPIGGIQTSRDGPIYVGTPSSNSHLGQYRYSETHQSRQHHGPTPDGQGIYPQDYDRDNIRYPGTGSGGYTGASGPYHHQQDQQHPPQSFGPPGGNAYGGFQQNHPPHPSQDIRFIQTGPIIGEGFQPMDRSTPFVATNSNMTANRGYQGDNYNSQRQAPPVPIPQPIYATTIQPQQAYNTQVPVGSYTQPHPQDVGYGRASPAGPTQQGYPQGPQYDEAPVASSRSTASPLHVQQAPPASNKRSSDRDTERQSAERHVRPAPGRR